MFALLLVAQVATAETVVTCRVPNDPHQRVWSLGRAQPAISSAGVTWSLVSANGGRRIDWTVQDGSSIALVCPTTVAGAFDDRSPDRHGVRSEWMVAAGVARSVRLFESTSGRAYAVQTLAYSRELTGELRVVGLRGRFAWGVEAMPLFAQVSPTHIYGVGVAPVVWRWNFPPRPSWSAFAELSMGGLWTSDAIPEKTSRLNFTAHWGGGIRRHWRANDALLLGYRFQHFSNGNQLGSNPGVNSHVFLAGWSYRRGVRL